MGERARRWSWLALGRWAVRLLRREWRENLLVLGLVAISIALASTGAILVHHLAEPAATFAGSATHEIDLVDDDALLLREEVARATASLEGAGLAVDLTVRRFVAPAGRAPGFSIIAPPAVSALGAEPVRIVDGVRPSGAEQVALSRPLASALGAGLGATVELVDRTFDVVGIAENPADLDEPLALVAPGNVPDPHSALLLVDGDADTSEDALGALRVDNWGSEDLTEDLPVQLIGVAQTYVYSAFAMLEVAMLGTAGFTVLAQRRIRQFGLLAAVGATRRQLRTACHLQGLVLGLVAGAVGVAVSYAGSFASRPLVEDLVNHRIDAWSLPWLAVVPFVVLGAATAVGASWWPAHQVARMSIVDALAARRGRAGAGRTRAPAAALTAGGVVAVGLGFTLGRPLLAVGGLIVALAGLLAQVPVLVGMVAGLAPRLPLAGRIAVRELGRHRRRSAAAIAALTVALGLPATIALVSASSDAAVADRPANLPANWVLLRPADADDWIPWIPADPAQRGAGLAEPISLVLPEARLAPVELAVPADSEPGVPPGGGGLSLQAVSLVLDPVKVDWGVEYRSGFAVPWVANAQLLDLLGIDPALASSAADVLSDGEHEIAVEGHDIDGNDGEVHLATTERIDAVEHGAVPDQFLVRRAVEERGERIELAGWLVANPTPITGRQVDELARFAGELVVETHDTPTTAQGLRWVVLAVSGVAALGVLAITGALVRLDAARSERTLAALGAGTRLRRRSAVVTTAFLAITSAALAVPFALLGLFAVMSDQPSDLHLAVPVGPLAVFLVGVPLVATTGTWVLTLVRRDPVRRPVLS